MSRHTFSFSAPTPPPRPLNHLARQNSPRSPSRNTKHREAVRREVFTPRELSRQTIYPRGGLSPEGVSIGNYAPGFSSFLSGSQLTPWRDIFLRVRETLSRRSLANVTLRNPTAGQDDLRMKSFGQALLLFPLAVDARRLPSRPDRPEPTNDPRKKSERHLRPFTLRVKRNSVDRNGTSIPILHDNPPSAYPRENYCAGNSSLF